MDPGGNRTGRYASLLRNPSFARLLTAGLWSVAGSSIAGICLVWIVYSTTGSALDVGLLGTSFLLAAILFSVFGGAWVDRYDRRRLMILADFARALAMGAVAADLLVRGFDLPGLLAANFVVGAFTTVFNPAEQAVVPAIVPAEAVSDANGLIRSTRSALQFVGASAAGGLIVAIGATAGVAVNAATFLISGLLLVGLRVPAPRDRGASAAPGAYLREVVAGFRWLREAVGFLELTLSATVFNFCSAVIGTFTVVFVATLLHGSALVFALMLATEVAGSAIGSLLVGATHGERRAGRAWVVPYGVTSGVVALALIVFPSVPVALALFFALGLLGGYAGTAWLTAAQLLVPSEMQGRYFGIDNLGSIAILPAAQIGGAFLILSYGLPVTYFAIALMWIGSGLLFLVPRALWNLGYPPTGATPPPT